MGVTANLVGNMRGVALRDTVGVAVGVSNGVVESVCELSDMSDAERLRSSDSSLKGVESAGWFASLAGGSCSEATFEEQKFVIRTFNAVISRFVVIRPKGGIRIVGEAGRCRPSEISVECA